MQAQARRLSRWGVVAALLTGWSCSPTDAEEGGSETADDLDGLHCSQAYDQDGDAWLELGQGVVGYEALVPGGELRIVLGGQGLLMFPIGLRAGGFCIPPDLSERDDFPVLDLTIDIEGEAPGYITVAEQPIDFEILEDDSFVWLYVPMLLPDDAVPAQLDGRLASVRAGLDPYRHAPLEVEVELVVGLEP